MSDTENYSLRDVAPIDMIENELQQRLNASPESAYTNAAKQDVQRKYAGDMGGNPFASTAPHFTAEQVLDPGSAWSSIPGSLQYLSDSQAAENAPVSTWLRDAAVSAGEGAATVLDVIGLGAGAIAGTGDAVIGGAKVMAAAQGLTQALQKGSAEEQEYAAGQLEKARREYDPWGTALNTAAAVNSGINEGIETVGSALHSNAYAANSNAKGARYAAIQDLAQQQYDEDIANGMSEAAAGARQILAESAATIGENLNAYDLLNLSANGLGQMVGQKFTLNAIKAGARAVGRAMGRKVEAEAAQQAAADTLKAKTRKSFRDKYLTKDRLQEAAVTGITEGAGQIGQAKQLIDSKSTQELFRDSSAFRNYYLQAIDQGYSPLEAEQIARDKLVKDATEIEVAQMPLSIGAANLTRAPYNLFGRGGVRNGLKNILGEFTEEYATGVTGGILGNKAEQLVNPNTSTFGSVGIQATEGALAAAGSTGPLNTPSIALNTLANVGRGVGAVNNARRTRKENKNIAAEKAEGKDVDSILARAQGTASTQEQAQPANRPLTPEAQTLQDRKDALDKEFTDLQNSNASEEAQNNWLDAHDQELDDLDNKINELKNSNKYYQDESSQESTPTPTPEPEVETTQELTPEAKKIQDRLNYINAQEQRLSDALDNKKIGSESFIENRKRQLDKYGKEKADLQNQWRRLEEQNKLYKTVTKPKQPAQPTQQASSSSGSNNTQQGTAPAQNQGNEPQTILTGTGTARPKGVTEAQARAAANRKRTDEEINKSSGPDTAVADSSFLDTTVRDANGKTEADRYAEKQPDYIFTSAKNLQNIRENHRKISSLDVSIKKLRSMAKSKDPAVRKKAESIRQAAVAYIGNMQTIRLKAKNVLDRNRADIKVLDELEKSADYQKAFRVADIIMQNIEINDESLKNSEAARTKFMLYTADGKTPSARLNAVTQNKEVMDSFKPEERSVLERLKGLTEIGNDSKFQSISSNEFSKTGLKDQNRGDLVNDDSVMTVNDMLGDIVLPAIQGDAEGLRKGLERMDNLLAIKTKRAEALNWGVDHKTNNKLQIKHKDLASGEDYTAVTRVGNEEVYKANIDEQNRLAEFRDKIHAELKANFGDVYAKSGTHDQTSTKIAPKSDSELKAWREGAEKEAKSGNKPRTITAAERAAYKGSKANQEGTKNDSNSGANPNGGVDDNSGVSDSSANVKTQEEVVLEIQQEYDEYNPYDVEYLFNKDAQYSADDLTSDPISQILGASDDTSAQVYGTTNRVGYDNPGSSYTFIYTVANSDPNTADPGVLETGDKNTENKPAKNAKKPKAIPEPENDSIYSVTFTQEDQNGKPLIDTKELKEKTKNADTAGIYYENLQKEVKDMGLSAEKLVYDSKLAAKMETIQYETITLDDGTVLRDDPVEKLKAFEKNLNKKVIEANDGKLSKKHKVALFLDYVKNAFSIFFNTAKNLTKVQAMSAIELWKSIDDIEEFDTSKVEQVTTNGRGYTIHRAASRDNLKSLLSNCMTWMQDQIDLSDGADAIRDGSIFGPDDSLTEWITAVKGHTDQNRPFLFCTTEIVEDGPALDKDGKPILGKNGKPLKKSRIRVKLDDKVALAASVALIITLNRFVARTKDKDSRDITKMLDRLGWSYEDFTSLSTQDQGLLRTGTNPNDFLDEFSRVFRALTGYNPKNDISKAYDGNMAIASLCSLALNWAQYYNFMHYETITVRDQNGKRKTSTYSLNFDDSVFKEINTRYAGEENVQTGEREPDFDIDASSFLLLGEFKNVLEHYLDESDKLEYYMEDEMPDPEHAHKLHDRSRYTKEQIKARKQMRKTKYFLNSDFYKAMMVMGEDGVLSLFGLNKDFNNSNVKNVYNGQDWLSQKGKQMSYRTGYAYGMSRAAVLLETQHNLLTETAVQQGYDPKKMTQDQWEELAKDAGLTMSQLYMRMDADMTTAGRWQESTPLGPQQDKLNRQLFSQINWKIKVNKKESDKEPISNYGFKLAVLQGLGLKLDKFDNPEQVDEAFARVLEIAQIHEGWSNTNDKETYIREVKNIFQELQAEGFDGISFLGLNILLNMEKYVQALKPESNGEFQCNVYLELDGSTNGYVNSVFKFASGKGFSEGEIRSLLRGSIFPGVKLNKVDYKYKKEVREGGDKYDNYSGVEQNTMQRMNNFFNGDDAFALEENSCRLHDNINLTNPRNLSVTDASFSLFAGISDLMKTFSDSGLAYKFSGEFNIDLDRAQEDANADDPKEANGKLHFVVKIARAIVKTPVTAVNYGQGRHSNAVALFENMISIPFMMKLSYALQHELIEGGNQTAGELFFGRELRLEKAKIDADNSLTTEQKQQLFAQKCAEYDAKFKNLCRSIDIFLTHKFVTVIGTDGLRHTIMVPGYYTYERYQYLTTSIFDTRPGPMYNYFYAPEINVADRFKSFGFNTLVTDEHGNVIRGGLGNFMSNWQTLFADHVYEAVHENRGPGTDKTMGHITAVVGIMGIALNYLEHKFVENVRKSTGRDPSQKDLDDFRAKYRHMYPWYQGAGVQSNLDLSVQREERIVQKTDKLQSGRHRLVSTAPGIPGGYKNINGKDFHSVGFAPTISYTVNPGVRALALLVQALGDGAMQTYFFAHKDYFMKKYGPEGLTEEMFEQIANRYDGFEGPPCYVEIRAAMENEAAWAVIYENPMQYIKAMYESFLGGINELSKEDREAIVAAIREDSRLYTQLLEIGINPELEMATMNDLALREAEENHRRLIDKLEEDRQEIQAKHGLLTKVVKCFCAHMSVNKDGFETPGGDWLIDEETAKQMDSETLLHVLTSRINAAMGFKVVTGINPDDDIYVQINAGKTQANTNSTNYAGPEGGSARKVFVSLKALSPEEADLVVTNNVAPPAYNWRKPYEVVQPTEKKETVTINDNDSWATVFSNIMQLSSKIHGQARAGKKNFLGKSEAWFKRFIKGNLPPDTKIFLVPQNDFVRVMANYGLTLTDQDYGAYIPSKNFIILNAGMSVKYSTTFKRAVKDTKTGEITQTVQINREYNEQGRITILHEMVHAVCDARLYYLLNAPLKDLKSKEERAAKYATMELLDVMNAFLELDPVEVAANYDAETVRAFEQLRSNLAEYITRDKNQNPEQKNQRDGNNKPMTPNEQARLLKEFIAFSLSEPQYIEALGKIKVKFKSERQAAIKNIYQRVIGWIKSILRIGSNKEVEFLSTYLGQIQTNIAVVSEIPADKIQVSIPDYVSKVSARLNADRDPPDLSQRINEIDSLLANKNIILGEEYGRVVQDFDLNNKTKFLDEVVTKAASLGFAPTPSQQQGIRHVAAAFAFNLGDEKSTTYLEAENLRRAVKERLSPKDFEEYEGDPNAEAKYDFFTNLDRLTFKEDDGTVSSLALPIFMALSYVSPQVREIMSNKDIPAVERSITGDSSIHQGFTKFDNYVYDLADRLLGGLGNIVNPNNKKNTNVSSNVDNYVKDIAAQNSRASRLSLLSTLLTKGENFTTELMSSAAQALTGTWFYKNVITAPMGKAGRHNRVVGPIVSSFRAGMGAVKATAAMGTVYFSASEDEREDMNEQIHRKAAAIAAASDGKYGIPRIFSLLASEAVRELMAADNYSDMIQTFEKKMKSVVQQARTDFRKQVPYEINKMFSDEGVKLDKNNKRSMNNILLRCDLGCLDDELINTILTGDGNNLEAQKRHYEAMLSKRLSEMNASYRDRAFIFQKAELLAQYMTSGQAGDYLIRNPTAMFKLCRSLQDYNPVDVQTLDRYITLLALKNMTNQDMEAVRSIYQQAPKAFNYCLGQQRQLANTESMNDLQSRTGGYNGTKGYYPKTPKGSGNLIAVKLADKEKYERMGYRQVQESALLKGTIYMSCALDPRATFTQGALQTIICCAGGADSATGYSRDPIITRVNANTLLAKNLRSHQGNGYETLVPVFASNGTVKAYEVLMDTRIANNIYQFEDDFTKNIGNWLGRQFEEDAAQEWNLQFIQQLARMYKSDETDGNLEGYVDVFKINDPVIKDAVKLLNPAVREAIKVNFPDGRFMVRRDMLEDVIGHRKASVTDMWTGNTRWSPEAQRRFVSLAEMFLGKNAMTKLLRAETFVQSATSIARNRIVIVSGTVAAANLIGNFKQLIIAGVSFGEMRRMIPQMLRETERYNRDRIKIIQLNLRRNAILGTKPDDWAAKAASIQEEIEAIRSSWNKMSIGPLLAAGEYSTIADIGDQNDQLLMSMGRFGDFLQNVWDHTPNAVKQTAKYGFITKGTPIYNALEKCTQYSDFIAKAMLYQSLTHRGVTPENALREARYQFVNYDMIPGRGREYLENMGIVWFYNYKLRSFRVAMGMLKHNSLKAIFLNLGLLPSIIDEGTPLTDNLIGSVLQGNLPYSLGPGMLIDSPTQNLWYNMFK